MYLNKSNSSTEGIWVLCTTLLTLQVYGLVSYFFIFKTTYLIDKLQLEKGFDQAEFPLNIHRSTVLQISVIVIGGLMVANEIPNLCRQLFSYYQEKRMTYGQTNPKIAWSVFSGVKIVIGLLLIGNQRQIVQFIEWKRKR